MDKIAIVLAWSRMLKPGFYSCPQSNEDIELDIEVHTIERLRTLVPESLVVVFVMNPDWSPEYELVHTRLANRAAAQISAFTLLPLQVMVHSAGYVEPLLLERFVMRLESAVNKIDILEGSVVLAVPS